METEVWFAAAVVCLPIAKPSILHSIFDRKREPINKTNFLYKILPNLTVIGFPSNQFLFYENIFNFFAKHNKLFF